MNGKQSSPVLTFECPDCRTSLVATNNGELTVNQCPGCQGQWLDPATFSKALKTMPAGSLASNHAPAMTPIKCLDCHCAIVPQPYAYDSGISILKCPQCGWLWLHRGQLQQLAAYRSAPHSTDGLASALGETFQNPSGSMLNKLLRSRLLSGLVVVALLVGLGANGAGTWALLRLSIFLLLPVACIWYAEFLGMVMGIRFGLVRPAIDSSTPTTLVALSGWLVLIAVVIVSLFLGTSD